MLVPAVKTVENFNLIIPEILFSETGICEIPIININKHKVVLNANTKLGLIEDVTEICHTKHQLQSFCNAASNATKMDFNINHKLNISQIKTLQNFLNQYSDVLATSNTSLYNGSELVRLNTSNHQQNHIRGLVDIGFIQSIHIPTTPTEVKIVLGLASFYRRFISRFTDISRPLINLTRNDTKFKWTHTCQKSFELLSLGFLLGQIQNIVERVIAYASRMMSLYKQNFSTSEKECLALIFALD